MLSPQEVFNSLHVVRDARLPSCSGFSHSVVIPGATYSPWLDDREFAETFRQVCGNTLVDSYRLYELWRLVDQTAGIEGDILEVGVWRGGSGCLLAKRAKQRTVFLCDTFTGVVKASDCDSSYSGGEHSDTSVEAVANLVEAMSLDNVRLLKGMFPEETATAIENRTFSLCHIDVDVYLSAKHVRDWVWPRLSVGGVVVYDDYGFSTCDGVTRMVNEFANREKSVTIHNLNGHAIVVKIA